MQYCDFQDQKPLAICKYCDGEIYSGDYIYNLDEVYMNGRYIIHEDCMLKDLEENKDLVTNYFFDDLCRLQDIFSELLSKGFAEEIFNNWDEECDIYE